MNVRAPSMDWVRKNVTTSGNLAQIWQAAREKYTFKGWLL
jgi:hypothetical protein